MKLLLLFLLLSGIGFAQAPDAPQPQAPKTWEQAKGKSAKLFTYRTNWQDPKLRSNKQVLKSPVFWLSQGALWVPMIVACRNPRSGEEFHSEVGAMAFMSGAMWFTDRYMSEMYSPSIAAYAAQHYVRADLQ